MRPATERLPAHLEPLRQECIEAGRLVASYHRSTTGINISAQEEHTANTRRWQYLIDQYAQKARDAGCTELYLEDLK